MTENLTYLKDTNLYMQIAQQIPSKIKSKQSTLRHVIVQLLKRDRLLKAAKEEQLLMYKGSSIRLTSNFSSETIEARGSGVTYLRCWKKKLSMKNSTSSKTILQEWRRGTSLVVQWLRIRLPMQGTRVRSLVREDPRCHGATKPERHNYWACALEPVSRNYWSPHA